VKAAQAFRYIEQYAANLINQPWRQEYRTIRQAARIPTAKFILFYRTVPSGSPHTNCQIHII
jgi:hypothetical protein